MARCIIFLLLCWAFSVQTSALELSEAVRNHRRNEWSDKFWNETFSTDKSSQYHIKSMQIEKNLKKRFLEKEIDNRNVISYRNVDDKSTEYLYEQLCPYDNIIDPIYEIIDNKGEIRYVVQNEKYFAQSIQLQKCSNPGKYLERKDFIAEDVGFHLLCQEKRLEYKFLVLSEDGESFEMVSVQNGLPISCYCTMIPILNKLHEV